MTRIGFLACAGTLPGSPVRRADAYEHDRQVEALRPAFAAQGLDLVEIDWRAPTEAFDGVPLVLLGTPWDYQDNEADFLALLDALEARGTTVCNPPALVRWNIDKAYLRDLAGVGIATIPTLWFDDPSGDDVSAASDHFDCDSVVVKRRVGAGAEGQLRFERTAPPETGWRYGHRAMIQPYIPAIVAEGEASFLFVDGSFSHGVRKLAKDGDYRIQSIYGGREQPLDPSPNDLAAAQAVVDAIPGGAPLYLRVDMVRLPSGELAVMEAEAIEPYLYPEQGPELGERMAQAVLRRLA